MTVYPRQQLCLAVIAGTPLLASCFVALRVYARRRARVPLGWDDHLIIAAAVLSIALIAPSFRNVYMWHYGIHLRDVDPKEWEPNFDEYHKVLLAFNIIHTLILPLVRASIILLLLRIAWVINRVRVALWVLLAFNTGACLGPWLAMIFMCPPLSGEKTGPTVFNGLSCLDSWQAAIIYVFIVTNNMFCDLLVFPIPVLLVWRLRNTSFQSRAAILISFALSLGVTAMAAVRLKLNWYSMLYHKGDADWTYTIIYCLNHAENNVAIIVACVPPVRGLIISWASAKEDRTQAQWDSGNTGDNQLRHGIALGSRDGTSIAESKKVNNSDSTLVEDIRYPERCKGANSSRTDRELEFL